MPLALTGPAGEIGAQMRRGAEFWAKQRQRQGRPARPADRAARRGHRRRSRHLRAQGAGGGGARRLPAAVRHDAVVRGARGGAEARRMERDLHVVRQRRRPADRFVVRAELLPRQHLRADGDTRAISLWLRKAEFKNFYALGMDYAWGHNSIGVFEDEVKKAEEEFRRRRCIRRSARRISRPTSPRSASPARMPASSSCRATTTTRSCRRRTNTGWATRCSCSPPSSI